MSLTDFFVASPKALREADPAKLPAPFKTFHTKNVDAVELGTLNEILTNSPDLPELAIEVSNEGPWVLRLPPTLTRALAGLEDRKLLKRVAAKWAKTDEFVAVGAKPADVEALLESLHALAASIGRRSLYVWTSL